MREPARDNGRLEHILTAINNIYEYVQDKSYENVVTDKILRHALTWNIQVIGETANNLTLEFINSHPETNWRGVIGMRHVLVHDYYHIDPEELWNVITEDLPTLKEQISKYIEEI